jgi:hypothetical protein
MIRLGDRLFSPKKDSDELSTFKKSFQFLSKYAEYVGISTVVLQDVSFLLSVSITPSLSYAFLTSLLDHMNLSIFYIMFLYEIFPRFF